MTLDSNVVTVAKQGRRETRRFLAVLAVAVLSLQVGGSASLLRAHGAELDSCGGHNDREHGGYHVHNWTAYCHCHPTATACVSENSTKGSVTPSTPGARVASAVAERPVPSISSLQARIAALEARVAALEKALSER